jgi:putative membrane protein
MDPVLTSNIISALIFAAIGIVIFVVFFIVIDWITPYNLWKELIETKNTALAMVVAAATIGICIIIAAAIH